MTSDVPPPAPGPMNWEARFKADDAPWERQGLHPSLSYWADQDLLGSGQCVYVPGCGRSVEPLALAKLGLDVTVSDIAPSAIGYQNREAKAQQVAINAIETDSLAWRPDTPFDLIYEQTFLCAIAPKLRPDYERMAYESLKPGGVLLALFMQKQELGGPPYGCSLQQMGDLFVKERWTWPEQSEFEGFPHPRLGDKAELAVPIVRV